MTGITGRLPLPAMFLLNALERLARRVWGERWNPMAHAEFRRSFSWRTIGIILLLQLICFGVVLLPWWHQDFHSASATARVILGLAWFVAAALCSSQGNGMFQTDNRLQVTEAWLLTSERRDLVLWSRLAGISMPGPLLVVGMAPLYYLAALGMSTGAGPLFICGHVARFGTAQASIAPGAEAFTAAALLAAMAMLADAVAPPAYAAITMPGSLYQAAARRLGFLPFFGIFRHGRLFLASLSLSVLALLAEVLLAIGAAYWLWGTTLWKLPPAVDTTLSLLLSAMCAGLLVGLRWLLAGAGIRMAARHYDLTLITDEPV